MRNSKRKTTFLESLESRKLLTTLADFDADGDLDALAHEAWFENTNGQGEFVAHRFAVTDGVASISADIDADGDLDIVTSEPSWYENDGTGGFIGRALPQPVANAVDRIVTADVGNDGQLDLVLFAGDELTLLTNLDGLGNFELGISGEFLGVTDADDFDGDGDLDYLAVVDGSLYLGTNTNGNFERVEVVASRFDEDRSSWTSDAEWASVDHDGQLDVVVTRHVWDDFGSASDLLVWVSAEDVSNNDFSDQRFIQGGCGFWVPGNRGSLRVSDWNQDDVIDSWCYADGEFDLATLQVTTQNGSGTFAIEHTVVAPEPFWFAIGEFSDVGDINRDGIPDFVSLQMADGVPQWIDGATGRLPVPPLAPLFTESTAFPEATGNHDEVELVDLDGDGTLEAILTADQNRIEVWRSEIIEQQIQWTRAATHPVEGVIYLATGDVNNDGSPDLVAATRSANHVFFNDGTGQLSDSGQRLGDAFTIDVALGDLDADGDLDIFAANSNAAPNRVWLNDGSGSFVDSGARLGQQTSKSVELGDIDNDGDLDAVVGNMSDTVGSSSENRIWWNDGSANFSGFHAFGGEHDTQHVAIADFNGDGYLDLFAVNSESPLESDQLFIQSTRRGTLAWVESQLGQGGPGSHVAIGDLDSDGDFDAIVAHWSQTPNRVWINDGNGLLTPTSDELATVTSSHVALGDVDNDGDLDAVLANFGDTTLFINSVNPAVLRDDLLPPTPVPQDDDHGNTIATATPIDRPTGDTATILSAKGNYPHDVDAFTFEALPRQHYLVDVTSGDVEIYIGNDRQRDSEFVETPNVARRLTILVHHPDADYELQVRNVPIDHGNDQSRATSISVPSTTDGIIIATGDEDFFRFDAVAGTTYEILVEHGTLEQSAVRVSDVRGPFLLSSYSGGARNRILYEHSGQDAGRFIQVEADGQMGRNGGTYRLTVREFDPTTEPIPGDSNRDGVFNSSDLVTVFAAGLFETGPSAAVSWETGDWNDDGEFNTADFVYAYTAGHYQV